jgi:hypothetical protein
VCSFGFYSLFAQFNLKLRNAEDLTGTGALLSRLSGFRNVNLCIQAGNGAFATSGRNTLQLPGIGNLDISLFKNFPSSNLRFRRKFLVCPHVSAVYCAPSNTGKRLAFIPGFSAILTNSEFGLQH